MPWMIVVILLTLLDKLSSEVACIRLADIYWNVTNPIFRIDNTDHIIDVNKGNVPFEYDQVNIICPVYPPQGAATDSTDSSDEEEETYIIYNVSKDEYDSCRITNPNPRIIAVCDKPHQLMYFTITFRSFTPQPGGLEFIPGHDYYFVSTSTGSPEGLHQKVGGRCATHNMKVIFKVCCGPDKGSTPSGSQRPPSAQSPASTATSTSAPEMAFSPEPASNQPYHHNRNVPYSRHPISSSTVSSTVEASSATPRWMRRPLYPSRVTPPSTTKIQRPNDEVPIEDEMARPQDGTLDHLPNKARSKNAGATSGSKSTSDGVCWTRPSKEVGHRWATASLVFQLMLSLLWR